MSQLYVRMRNRLVAVKARFRNDDRGEVVERVVLIGLGLTAALAAGWAIVNLTNEGIARWELW